MALAAGIRLGAYEILAPIGAGGMGEVYRAKDTKLDREVAIKVLPAALEQDPERLARFEREAKVLASHLWQWRNGGVTPSTSHNLASGQLSHVTRQRRKSEIYRQPLKEASSRSGPPRVGITRNV